MTKTSKAFWTELMAIELYNQFMLANKGDVGWLSLDPHQRQTFRELAETLRTKGGAELMYRESGLLENNK